MAVTAVGVLGALAVVIDSLILRAVLAFMAIPAIALAYPLGELLGHTWCSRGLSQVEKDLIEAMRFATEFNDPRCLRDLAAEHPETILKRLEELGSDIPEDEVVRAARQCRASI